MYYPARNSVDLWPVLCGIRAQIAGSGIVHTAAHFACGRSNYALPEGDVNRQKENAFPRLEKNKNKIKVSKTLVTSAGLLGYNS
jgi:hypothetical protein